MSEPQLERSVLEAKEREELFAIAGALGTKPASRARKADLIAQILRATGVEEAPAEVTDKPKRPRSRKVTTSDADVAAEPGSGAGTGSPDTSAAAAADRVGDPDRQLSLGVDASSTASANGG